MKGRIDIVEELLNLNEGISVLGSKASEQQFSVKFTTVDAQSRLLIHHVAEASNINLSACSVHRPGSIEAKENPGQSLVYRFHSTIEADAQDELCWLGAHLTWSMHDVGQISDQQEREYCDVFGAKSRSA